MGHAQQLPGALHALQGPLDHYGLAAVGLFLVLEDFGVPVPGETTLILAAVYAGTGRMNLIALIVVGILAAVLGDNIGFGIGHFGGQPFIDRFGRYIMLTPERAEKATGWFQRHGGKVIVIARFVEGLRQANGIISGTSGMHWRKFLFFNVIGASLWVGVWIALGDAAGNHINTIYADAMRYSAYFGALVGVLIIAFIVMKVVKRRRGKAAASEDRNPAPPS